MSRIRIVFFFFIVFFIAIVVKLFYFQVLRVNDSSRTASLQYRRIFPERGKIYDRTLQPLATNQTKYLLFAEPKKVVDKHDFLEKISKILEVDEASIEARFNDKKDWVSLATAVSRDKHDKLVKAKIDGIGFEDQSERYYPEASLAAHLLGFVGKNKDGENTGYYGIEGYYDQDLIGLPGVIKMDQDAAGRPILVGNRERIDSDNGRDLVLTIDKSVQEIAKKKLLEGVEKYKAKEGCVLIADPKTMEMLAVSCIPDFDPSNYNDASQSAFGNPAISTSYEPGSTFKPLIVAAGIEEKKIKPDDFYDENGPIERGGFKIQTWDNKYEGKITITRILEKSSNVGMVFIGDKLGNANVLKYIQNFGYGQPTGVDLQGEAAGVLRPKNQWYAIDYATATFGQGIAVTPLQQIRAFAAVINGGELLEPHIVKSIRSGDTVKEINKKVIRRIISERTSAILRKMLVDTVEHGEYKYAVPEGYKIGGKTGTAQIAVAGHYDPSKTIASFVGFAPADDPKFIALVVLKQPGTSIYGSETAAPLFFEIAKELLFYYNISPSNP
ncbi:penicillin-binding protein 2 [Candidatus Microgenomates bacterium]|nr:penicillin-binding protein 2 [Candidatus Microgenomates bacterium]